jgi:hypothetical protein
VGVGGLFGGFGVADAEGVDDALVLLESGVDAVPDGADLFQIEDPVELLQDRGRQLRQPVVAGGAGDGGVEGLIRLPEGRQVLAAGRVDAVLGQAF